MKTTNFFKRVVALVLAGMMLFSVQATVMAETESSDVPEVETVWNEIPEDFHIEAGQDGYNFISFGMPDGSLNKDGSYKYYFSGYEKSQHILKINGSNAIAELFILADASKTHDWRPDGKYSFGVSNYEVLYCCDRDTGFEYGKYYKRINLEDSSYYSADEAAHIRAIVTNSYPYVSIDRMKEILKADGFEDADKLDRAEIIAAVQAAIWSFSNKINLEDIEYLTSADTSKFPGWGRNLHDYAAECEAVKSLGSKKAAYPEIGERILSLVEHLRGMDRVYAEENAIIITKLEILNASPVANSDGSYKTTVRVALNNGGSSEKDDIKLDIYVDDVLVKSKKVNYEISTYDVTVDAKAGQTIKAVVSGTQIMPKDVYFYEAEGGRKGSQSLVGVAEGETDVYVAATLKIEKESDIPVNKTATPLNKYAQTDVTLFVPEHYTGEDTDRVFCAAGSYVEDFIGYDPAVGDFEFITDADTIKLVVGGKTYITTQIETAEGATASYSFTKPDATEPSFWLDYYKGNGTTTERFIWTYGEDITLSNNAALTYRLQLHELATVDGVYTIDTNLSATLYPRLWKPAARTFALRSSIEFGDPVIFPVPSVEYKVVRIIEGSKTWDDVNDADGIRPESITIRLFANGTEIASKVVTEADGWAWDFGTFTKYDENGEEIVYTIAEDAVEGYDTEINGFDVTNTHIPATVVSLGGIKYLDKIPTEGYEFQITLPDGSTLNAISGTDGIFSFGEFRFEAEGTYQYVIREVIGTDTLIEYDTSVYVVTIDVKLENGAWTAQVTVLKDGQEYEGQIEFNNTSLADFDDELPPGSPLPPVTGDSFNRIWFLMAILSSMLIITEVVIFRKKLVCKK